MSLRVKDDNIVRNANGQVEQILCWICDVVVCAYVDEDIIEQRDVGGQKIHKIRQRFRSLGTYAKADFLLDDGSTYSPIVCTKCKPLLTPEIGGQILNKDIALHIRDKGDDDFAKELKKRTVLGERDKVDKPSNGGGRGNENKNGGGR